MSEYALYMMYKWSEHVLYIYISCIDGTHYVSLMTISQDSQQATSVAIVHSPIIFSDSSSLCIPYPLAPTPKQTY